MNSDKIYRLTAGMCNRFREMLALKQVFPKGVSCYWEENSNLTGHFLEYFEPINGITFVKQKNRENTLVENGTYKNIVEKHGLAYDKNIEAENYKLIKPQEYLLKKIEEVNANLTLSDKCGLHIRRVVARCGEGYANYFLTTEDDFERFAGDDNVFLATDSLELQRRWTKKPNVYCYARLIEVPEKDRCGSRFSSIEDAIIDLFCLSKCKRFLGTHWSSYSSAAVVLANPDPKLTFGFDDKFHGRGWY